MTLGDRVVVMKDGWVQQVGEPLELYNTPANQLRRRLHRLAGDELRRRSRVAEATARSSPKPPGFSIDVPASAARAPRGHTTGQQRDARHPAGGPPRRRRPPISPDHCFDAVVEVVEQLGSEILLDTRAGPALVVASVEPTAARCAPTTSCGWRSSPSACTCSMPQNEDGDLSPVPGPDFVASGRPSLPARPTWPCAAPRATS